jgi:prolyl 4-hydroxylase
MNDALAAIGRNVVDHLSRDPGVQIVSGQGLVLYVRQGFLTADECVTFITLIDANRHPSEVLSVGYAPEFRTSESCDLDRWDDFVRRIDQRIASLMGIEESYGETLQGQRYAVGQQFKAHFDHFPPETDYGRAAMLRGGQRSWTAMVYLNEPDAGGETWFSAAGLKVTPRTAMLIAWDNSGADGLPNTASLHESLPVTAGVKYIVTKWFRERAWV